MPHALKSCQFKKPAFFVLYFLFFLKTIIFKKNPENLKSPSRAYRPKTLLGLLRGSEFIYDFRKTLARYALHVHQAASRLNLLGEPPVVL